MYFRGAATTQMYALSLHDALPIYESLDAQLLIEPHYAAKQLQPVQIHEKPPQGERTDQAALRIIQNTHALRFCARVRSEEHTSELQSRLHLVCRLLLENKNLLTTL